MTYRFDVILDAYTLDDVPVAVLDALVDAGCDDGFPSSSNGLTKLSFYREAGSLEDAIRSALRDVSAGLKAATSPLQVLRVEIAPAVMAEPIPG
jgi:hypothetical protein